ncbi:hypothetical protein ON010_g18208 [Phytophthora cinnamomi]|nr:hypothetical protein ON010_g18208 [Phytophthora cinnamomi]
MRLNFCRPDLSVVVCTADVDSRRDGRDIEQPPVPVTNQQRQRQAKADDGASEVARRKKQRRQAENAARGERAARRQDLRNQQAATDAQTAGADAARGIHGGESAERGRDSSGGGGVGDGPPVPVGNRARQVAEDSRRDGGDREGGDGAGVGMLRGRGRPCRQMPLPEQLQVQTAGFIVERAQRRVRNRAGLYVIEHEVEYSTRRG